MTTPIADEDVTTPLAVALVEANDQLLALYDLVNVTATSLDEADAVASILQRAGHLLRADAMSVSVGGNQYGCGEAHKVAELRDSVALATTGSQSQAASVVVKTPTGDDLHLSALRESSPLGTAGTKLLSAVAAMLAGAVNTAHLHTAAVSQAVMANEHEVASRLAQSALPKTRPTVDGVTLYARSEPARSAGGDLFNYSEADGRLCFAVGDVSGKGLPAAMIMTQIISASNVAFERHGYDGPAPMLELLDHWVFEYLSESALFVTLIMGTFDPTDRLLRLANAGHSPVLLLRGGEPIDIPASAPPVGVLPLSGVESRTIEVERGDLLVIASDGLTEQLNPEGEMFGDDRLLELIVAGSGELSSLASTVYTEVEKFAAGAPQTDDRTLALFSFTGES